MANSSKLSYSDFFFVSHHLNRKSWNHLLILRYIQIWRSLKKIGVLYPHYEAFLFSFFFCSHHLSEKFWNHMLILQSISRVFQATMMVATMNVNRLATYIPNAFKALMWLDVIKISNCWTPLCWFVSGIQTPLMRSPNR